MALAKVISNVLFCLIFFLAAINHIMHFEEEIPKLVAVGIPIDVAPICFGAAIGLMILGTILIISMQYEIFGYICYVGFLIPATWFMHIVPYITASYNSNDPNAQQIMQINMIQTMKNVSLIGACFKFILNESEKANKYVAAKKNKASGKKSKKRR